MKKTALMTVFVLTALVITGSALAQAKSRVTIGGSYWNANYSMVDKDGNELGKFGTGNMFGPYLRFSHGKLNFGTSMFFGSFPVEGWENFGGDGLDLTMSRADLNFTVGYRVIPYINLFVGVKYLNYSFDGDISYENQYWTGEYDYWGNPIYDFETVNANMEVSESGPMYGFGVAGVIPFGQSPLYGFASIAGMVGTLTNETKVTGTGDPSISNQENVDASLGALTIGIGYHTPSGLGLSVGYKADLFDEKISDSNDEPNIYVQGLYLTLSYTF